ncbi:MAG: TlpA family protein disulfide reductase, partial [Sphingobacteriales bacterium]
MKNKVLLIILFCLFGSAVFAQSKLPIGIWRGVITNTSGHDLPFNFEVRDTAGHQQIVVMNGAERLKVTEVKSVGDSVFIHMPLFDSEFKLKLVGNKLQGNWIKHSADKQYFLPFKATANTNYRFFAPGQASNLNVAGRWTAIFGDGASRD